MLSSDDKYINRDKLINAALYFSALAYASLLLSLLFFKNREYVSSNFVPFNEIKRYLFTPGIPLRLVLGNLLGNVLLFLPLGLYLRLLLKRLPSLAVFLLCALLSTGAEFVQLVYSLGSCDVDDIILNSLGAALGIALHAVLSRLFKEEYKLRLVTALFVLTGSVSAVTGWIFLFR
jgi:glycopeptide antibiotics resistance protein